MSYPELVKLGRGEGKVVLDPESMKHYKKKKTGVEFDVKLRKVNKGEKKT